MHPTIPVHQTLEKLKCPIGIPCLVYIDDRHNGQLLVPYDKGGYAEIGSAEQRNFAAAKSVICIMAFHLVKLGYFLGLAKSILVPQKCVPYLGFITDSMREVFHLKPNKRSKFIQLIKTTLAQRCVTVKTLQRIVGNASPSHLWFLWPDYSQGK